MNPQEQNPSPPVTNPLAAMRPGEEVICEIKRHPIGLIGTYGIVGIFLIVMAVFTFVLAPDLFPGMSRSQAIGATSIIFLILAAISLGFLFVFNIVYAGNRWIVTSDSITQVQQNGLFDKQSSQLSLANLEDVTTEQNGILTHIFNYGVIKAETAGERSKFRFTYAPNPNYYAQKILAAREEFEQGHHGGKQVPYEQPPTTTAGTD